MLAGHQVPMQELAQREAALLGRVVTSVEIVAVGDDERGNWINFDVTYSSSEGGTHERARTADS